MKSELNQYFKSLTGLRAVAAYMVFLMHFNPADENNFFFKIFSQFYSGVSIFFILSGFLITYRYSEGFSISSSWILKYLKNRIARIYPLYFFLTSATLIVSLFTTIGNDFTFVENLKQQLFIYFLNITFLRGFFFEFLFSMISQGWSLTVEETFYLTAPLMWYFREKINLLLWVFILFCIGNLFCIIGVFFPVKGFFVSEIFMLKFTFFGRAIQFVAGMILAKSVLIKKQLFFKNKTYIGLLVTIISIVSLALVWKVSSVYFSILIDNFLLTAGVSILILGLIEENTLVSRVLSNKFVNLLGKSSYAFYLIHVGIFQNMLVKIGIINILFQFVALVFISIFLYMVIENPFRKRIINFKLKGFE